MSRRARLGWLTAVLVGALGGTAYAECRQPRPDVAQGPPSVLIIMDASKSMAKPTGDGRTRLEAAKEALRSLVDELPDDARVGLRLYGHRYSDTSEARGCTDTELVEPVGPLDRESLLGDIDAYEAVGFTPIGRSLREGADDLPDEGASSIVLVSDGGDNCAGSSASSGAGPCTVAEQIAAEGTAVSIQAVGFQVSTQARESLECVAEEGGGVYRDAEDTDELSLALKALAARSIRSPEPAGEPVTGGAGGGQAVALEPGRYLDELGLGEQRWYRVEVAAGQRLAASAALVAPCPPQGLSGDLGSALTIQFHPPEGGERLFPPGYSFTTALFSGELNVAGTGLIGPPVDPRRPDRESFSAPGAYLVSVQSRGSPGYLRSAFGTDRVPMELLVNAVGEPVRFGDDASAPGGDGEDEGESPAALVAMVVVLALVLGGAGGAMAMRRSRRSG